MLLYNAVPTFYIIDVRLDNGITPNEGTVWYTEDCQNWYRTCGLNLGIKDVIVICRHLGFAGANRALMNSPFGGPFDNQTQMIIDCGEEGGDITTCTLTGCPSGGSTGGAVCYGSNYLGCYTDMMDDRVLNGPKNNSFGGLTIDKCLGFCRPFPDMVFAGLENGNECYCGDSLSNFSKHGPVSSDSQCHVPCDGSQFQSCGASGYVAIFNHTITSDGGPTTATEPGTSQVGLTGTTKGTTSDSDAGPTTSTEPGTSHVELTGTTTGTTSDSDAGPTTSTEPGTSQVGLTSTTTGTTSDSDAGPTTSTEPGTSQVGLTGTTKGTTSDSDAGPTTFTEPGTSHVGLTVTTKGTTSNSDEGPTNSTDTSLSGTVTGPGLTSVPSSPPAESTTTSYAAIGGGVVAAVVVFIIVTILVYRCKGKPKQDHKYGVSDTRSMDMKDDQQGEIEKNAATAQMKKGTMPLEYVNMKDRGNPRVMEQESSNENLGNDAAGENAVTSKEAEDFEGLYAVSMKHRPGPDGGEVAKDAGIIYAVPEKGRKSKASLDASVQSLPDKCEEDVGDLYAVPEKNRKSKVSQNVPVLPLTDDLEAMYAMPNKPRFRQEDDRDTTEMVENDLYGSR
eukprot:XP_011683237.1 PREDICTED: uncharacterized protein LOC105447180 [Strongylocentrotus purpuratus]